MSSLKVLFASAEEHPISPVHLRSLGPGSQDRYVNLLYGPPDTSPPLNVWMQVLLLHSIAVLLAGIFYLLRLWVISCAAVDKRHECSSQRRWYSVNGGKQANTGKQPTVSSSAKKTKQSSVKQVAMKQ